VLKTGKCGREVIQPYAQENVLQEIAEVRGTGSAYCLPCRPDRDQGKEGPAKAFLRFISGTVAQKAVSL